MFSYLYSNDLKSGSRHCILIYMYIYIYIYIYVCVCVCVCVCVFVCVCSLPVIYNKFSYMLYTSIKFLTL